MRVNRAQLADIFGVSLPTVTAWHREGMPAVQEGRKGKEWVFDTVDCLEWYFRRKFKPQAASIRHGDPFADPSDAPETIEQAQLRKESALADKHELAAAKEAGLLVPVDEVAAIVAEENARVRARLLGIPNELRPLLLTHLGNDRKAAEQCVSRAEAIIHEALAEVQSYAEPEVALPEVANDADDGDD